MRFCFDFTVLAQLCLMTLLGFNINFANAALTTVTANTIQGTKPILVKTGTTTGASLNGIVSVIMPDGTTILSPGRMITYTVAATDKLADIKPYIAYLDIDGDLGDSNHRLQGVDGISSVTYTWKDKNNRVVTDILEAFAECLSPYTLAVYANNAQAVSSYGSLYHILCKFIITNNQSLDYQNGS